MSVERCARRRAWDVALEMNDSLSSCALAEFGPAPLRKRGGGPNSPQGKGNSSQNARKHGCRSKAKIVPGEQRADYDALWDQWLTEFEPESPGDLAQLERVVDGDWQWRRTQRAYNDLERALREKSEDAAEWSPELLARLQVMARYRTTAENSFYRALRTLEFQKARRDAERRNGARERAAKQVELEKWEQEFPRAAEARRQHLAEEAAAAEAAKGEPTRAELLFRGQNCPLSRKPASELEQTAVIRVVDGCTVTELSPSDEELIEQGKAMMPPPGIVVRYLYFTDGVPAEYEWVGAPEAARRAGEWCGVQRMTADTWLDLIEREAIAEGGHLLPTPNLLLRQQRGLCECPVCVTRAKVWLAVLNE